MSESLYKVVSDGSIRPGFTQEQVKDNLREQLHLNPQVIEALFSDQPVVIKRNIDFAKARKYEQQFFLQGLIVKNELVLTDSSVDELRPPSQFAIDESERTSFAKEAELAAAEQQNITAQTPPPVDGAFVTPSTDDSTYPKVLPFEFNGRGGEYFKIWIVNIILTILTLGIYSAWAKVRNKQYFYGNTFLDNASFEYTAKPLQILKGRIVAFIVVGIYVFLSAVLPPKQQIVFGLVASLFFAFIIPWVVVKGLQFNARHSNYRNINFGFDGTYWGAFKAFILWPIASITLFLIPFAWHRQTHFFVDNSRYGTSPFQFSATVKDYYRIFGVLFGIGFGLGIIVMVLFGISAAGVASTGIGILIGLVYLVGLFALRAYADCSMNNLMYNGTILKEHSLTSDYDVKSYLILMLTNTLGIVLTLGFFTPWAMVRTARYHADKTNLIAAEDLNNFIAAEEQHVNTLAEGLADTHDMFDVGVGI